jgi:hypothetical protein
MKPGLTNWLATLRRRQRVVLRVLVPVFALSAASSPACAAMTASVADAATEAHHAARAHAAHHDHEAAHTTEQPVAPAATACPHCPLEAGAANAGHGTCTSIDGRQDGSAQQHPPVDRAATSILPPNWLLPAARAAPPLIGPFGLTAPLVAPVPLNLRHCVLLI